MISREPTIERLATAQRLLLEPFGLDETHLARALAEITAHRVDDADLYFQYTRSEGWSLEEGIVKTGSFSIDQGVGVRAVSGEKTAFAYSDDISEASLLDAARTVRTISAAAGHRPRQGAARKKIAGGRSLYQGLDPIATLDSTAKVQLLERAEKLARSKDPRVAQVMAGLASEYDVVHGRARRRHAGRRRAAAGAPVDHRDRRAERPARDGLGRRRRPLRPGLLRRRAHRELCERRREGGADQPRFAPGAGRRNDRGAGPGLARHPAARSDRPRPGGRLQPQGLERVFRPRRPARGGQGRDGAGRRHHRRPARLAQRRRRRQRQPAQRADRGRHPARLHPGFAQCPPDGRRSPPATAAAKAMRISRCRA